MKALEARGLATFEYDSGVWIEETATHEATEQGARNERFLVMEDVVTLDLLPAASIATRASKLSIKYIERFGLWT